MTTTTPARTLLPASAMVGLPWEDLHGTHGARTKVLWRDRGALAGILLLEPGTSIEPHLHDGGDHHAYVVEGRCRIDGEYVTEGSYVHIGRGERHAIACAGGSPCRLFYLFTGDAT